MRGQPGTEVMADLVARIDKMNQLAERSRGVASNAECLRSLSRCGATAAIYSG